MGRIEEAIRKAQASHQREGGQTEYIECSE